MAPSPSAQNALLAALAAVAVGASGFAIWSVNRPPASVTDPGSGWTAPARVTDTASATTSTTPTGSTTAAPGPGDSVAPTAVATAPDSAEATATAYPDDDAATGSAAPTDEPATVQEWVEAWADEADLLVIGDGYSNLASQWVQQWATLLAQDRPVQIRHWGEAEDRSFTDPITLSEGDGPALRVWSAGRAGTTIADATARLDRFDRASANPDAILVSLGMDSGDEDVPAAMDELLAGLHDVPVLIVIPPEGLYEPAVADDLLGWAEAHEGRVALVDLRESELVDATGEGWALAFRQALSDAAR